jgi:hypothetical protein
MSVVVMLQWYQHIKMAHKLSWFVHFLAWTTVVRFTMIDLLFVKISALKSCHLCNALGKTKSGMSGAGQLGGALSVITLKEGIRNETCD